MESDSDDDQRRELKNFESKKGIRVLKKKPKITKVEIDKKLHYTDYFVTISTNIKPKNEQDAFMLESQLTEAIDEVFEQPEKFITFVEGEKEDWEKIKKFKYTGLTEIGEGAKGKRVHWHGKIQIEHYTKIRVFKEVIKPIFDKVLKEKIGSRFKKCYFSHKWIPSTKPIQSYITKNYKLTKVKNINFLEEAMSKLKLKIDDSQKDLL
jgi:hypothetical protein